MSLSTIEVLHTEEESMSNPEPGLRRQAITSRVRCWWWTAVGWRGKRFYKE